VHAAQTHGQKNRRTKTTSELIFDRWIGMLKFDADVDNDNDVNNDNNNDDK